MNNVLDGFMSPRKRLSFSSIYIAGLLPVLGYCIGGWGNWLFLVMFLLTALLDKIGGRDTRNPSPEQESALLEDRYFRFILLGIAPWHTALLFFMFWAVTTKMAWWEFLGLVWGVGQATGATGINVAHELIHRNTRLERLTGGYLLAQVLYATFKIEHVAGHHVHVSTPEDASSATKGQTLYQYIPQAVRRNVIAGWRLEAQRLRRKKLRPWSYQNQLIWWSLVSIGFICLSYLVGGLAGLCAFLLQALFAVELLETINYTEHYGLARRKLANSSYERVTTMHSWNASERLSNETLINLQRHSDHHANPGRRFQVLRHHDESPQLPTGYPGMVLLAHWPRRYFALMNPLVDKHMHAQAQRYALVE
jgi:alkane 1-monooxygenase